MPIPSKHLGGLDSLLSMVQMPKGIPVATFAIGDAGSANAGLFAVAMLAVSDEKLAGKLKAFRAKQVDTVKAAKLPELLPDPERESMNSPQSHCTKPVSSR